MAAARDRTITRTKECVVASPPHAASPLPAAAETACFKKQIAKKKKLCVFFLLRLVLNSEKPDNVPNSQRLSYLELTCR
jgi:hypothetical protein